MLICWNRLGLREIVSTLNSRAPEAPVGAKVRLARGPVSRLAGQYELWRGEWPNGPVACLTATGEQALADDYGAVARSRAHALAGLVARSRSCGSEGDR